MTDPALDPDRIADMRRALGSEGGDGAGPGSTPAPMQHAAGALRQQGRRGRNLLRRVLSRFRRAGDSLRGYDPRTVGRLSADLGQGMRDLDARFELLRAEVRALAVWVGAEDPRNLGGRVDAIGTNLELMKAELRSVEGAMGALGDAIAPGAGLDAVAPRMAELRERLNALDRRVRQLAAAPP